MFRVYYNWKNRNAETKADFTSYEDAMKAIYKKFENKNCFAAHIENMDTCESYKFIYNEV